MDPAVSFSEKPFVRALCLRAESIHDEALKDLHGMGLAAKSQAPRSPALLVGSAAIIVSHHITCEACEVGKHPSTFMPTVPIPKTANMTVAFGLFVLANIVSRAKTEGVEVNFLEAAVKTAAMFYSAHSDIERAQYIKQGMETFQSLARADQSNIHEWKDNCSQLVQLYVLQWDAQEESARSRDFRPLFGSLLSSLLRTVA
jgi:hypothetical protein